MWVCEAGQVNIWTVFAVRPNGANKNKNNNNNNNFASSRSDHVGSDKKQFHQIDIKKKLFHRIDNQKNDFIETILKKKTHFHSDAGEKFVES